MESKEKQKVRLLRKGIEPLPIAWKAIIQPLHHRSGVLFDLMNIVAQ
jgi:hypothetical protein